MNMREQRGELNHRWRPRSIPDTKVCSRCKAEKPIIDFHKQSSSPDGHNCYCKACNCAAVKAHYRRKGHRTMRDRNLRKAYGIGIEDYEAMLESQGHRCAACGCPPRADFGFHVDHDHSTGVVRGLLCVNCNWAIGHAFDSVERLQALIGYLEEARRCQ